MVWPWSLPQPPRELGLQVCHHIWLRSICLKCTFHILRACKFHQRLKYYFDLFTQHVHGFFGRLWFFRVQINWFLLASLIIWTHVPWSLCNPLDTLGNTQFLSDLLLNKCKYLGNPLPLLIKRVTAFGTRVSCVSPLLAKQYFFLHFLKINKWMQISGTRHIHSKFHYMFSSAHSHLHNGVKNGVYFWNYHEAVCLLVGKHHTLINPLKSVFWIISSIRHRLDSNKIRAAIL